MAFAVLGALQLVVTLTSSQSLLALGLEFQLASDVLTTAVAPTFVEIGKLAAIATIRTALNYFLAREIKSEREELERAGAPDHPPPP